MTKLSDFEYNGKTIPLKKPLKLEKTEYGNFVTLAYHDLELYGTGSTEKEAFEMIREVFSQRYEEAKKILDLVG